MKICNICGELFIPPKTRSYYRRRTCSDACKNSKADAARTRSEDNTYIPPDEIWRRAAIVKNNTLVKLKGIGELIEMDW